MDFPKSCNTVTRKKISTVIYGNNGISLVLYKRLFKAGTDVNSREIARCTRVHLVQGLEIHDFA